MKIEKTMRNQISADQAWEMICSRTYQEQKCVDAGALSYDVQIDHGDGDTVTIKTKRKLPTVGFPSLLRKFVPSGVTSTETIRWGPAAEDHSRTGELSVDFHGAPASMNGTIRLVPESETSTAVHLDAVFTAHVPLVGRKVEGFAAPIIVTVIDAEEQTAQAWAAERA